MHTWKALGKFDRRRSDGICLHLSFDEYLISHEARHLSLSEVLALYALIATKYDKEAVRGTYSESIRTSPEGGRFALRGRYDGLPAGLSADEITASIDRLLDADVAG